MVLRKIIQTDEQDGVVVLSFTANDYASPDVNQVLREEIVHAIDDATSDRFVVCLRGVHRLTSETIGTLLKARERVMAKRGKMALCSVHPDVCEILRLVQLSGQVLSVCNSVEEAVELLRESER